MAALKNAAIFFEFNFIDKLHYQVIPKKARLRNLQLPSKKLVCIRFLSLVEMTSTLAVRTGLNQALLVRMHSLSASFSALKLSGKTSYLIKKSQRIAET